jgi:hemerythrin-like metal-binding protein
MQKYIWIQKYSVGVKSIDDQHKHFFDMAGDIIKLTGQNVSSQDLLLKISNLSDYANYHFSMEEEIFTKYNYSDADEHIKEHDSYRKKMRKFMDDANEAGTDVNKIVLEIAEFAGSWLVNHVMNVDQKYVGFMRENGIK